MNTTELVTIDIYKLLDECKNDLDLIPQAIALLEELYMRRQEDEEKILQVIQVLDSIKIRSNTQDVSSLLLLTGEDDY